MPLMIGLGAVLPIAGGVVGNIAAGDDRDKAKALQAKALQSIMGVNAPSIDEMKIALQQYQSAGQLDPQMQAIIAQDPSAMQDIAVDPRLRQAQMNALQKLQSISVGGLRPEDKAALDSISKQTAQQANSRDQAMLQNMQERGIGGSGAELAARLGNSQAAANRQSTEGMNVGALASQNALNAIMQSGQLGSQQEQTQFGEEAQKASAADIINRYNAMNRQQVTGSNTANTNAAQATNLANKQQLMNQNTGLVNQQEMYNKGLHQQNFNNQMAKAGAAAGAQNTAANQANATGDRTAQMWSSIGSGAGQAAGAGAQYSQNQDYMNILKNNKAAAPAGNSAGGGSFNASGIA